MTAHRAWVGLAGAAALAMVPRPAGAQEPAFMPSEVRFAVRAADSILTSPAGGLSLEAFRGDTVTGVYLQGAFGGRAESIGYGADAGGRRYLWFSIGRAARTATDSAATDSVEYLAMLFDVDRDLTPDFLLFRTIDRAARIDVATEYRAPNVAGQAFDITFQPACAPPRCDPATWTVRPRRGQAVSAAWFDAWRPLFAIAAMRGERWLGEPVGALHAAAPPGGR